MGILLSETWWHVQGFAKQQRALQGEESSDEDVPEDFIDPIMMITMSDPVLLPDSRTAVDRCPPALQPRLFFHLSSHFPLPTNLMHTDPHCPNL